MKTNNYYEIKTIILYGKDNQIEKPINPYQAKAFYITKNIFNEDIESSSDYFNIEIKNLILCNNNEKHINAKKNKNMIFFVAEPGTIQGTLYIPFDVVLSHDVIEEKNDYAGRGCVCVSYNDKITFNSDFIKLSVMDSISYFAKPNDKIDPNWREDVEELEEEITSIKEKMHIFPKYAEHKKRVIALYESKLKEGYKYIVFRYRCKPTQANYIILYNCVDHYEKTKEYIKLEKLTQQLKTYCDRWTIQDTERLLKDYKLTKIRK